MLTKAQIVQLLRKLHQKREPLNLSAMKRSHPKVVDRVFTFKRFWGWKQALADAGIDYAKIKVELLDYAICEECGMRAATLGKHVSAVHGFDLGEYPIVYPGAELMAEALRSAKTMGGSRRSRRVPKSGVPHWEPLWTAEYVLDRVAEFHRRGLPLNFEWVRVRESPLSLNARKFFGSWDEVLSRLGLDPASVRTNIPAVALSRSQVLAAIRNRRKGCLPLNYKAVENEDMRLANAARRIFGSYDNALRAARIDPRTIRQHGAKHSESESQKLIAAVRKVAALPEPDRTKKWRRLKKRSEPLALSFRFGSWQKVFAEAGVDRDLLIRPRFPDRESVLAIIRDRIRAGLPVNANAIYRHDRTLYDRALELFGAFAEVGRVLGLA